MLLTYSSVGWNSNFLTGLQSRNKQDFISFQTLERMCSLSFLTSIGCLLGLSHGALPFSRSAVTIQAYFTLYYSVTLILPFYSIFKCSCYNIGHTQIIQNIIPTLKITWIVYAITCAKHFFPFVLKPNIFMVFGDYILNLLWEETLLCLTQRWAMITEHSSGYNLVF
jgi:hypothetical protein